MSAVMVGDRVADRVIADGGEFITVLPILATRSLLR